MFIRVHPRLILLFMSNHVGIGYDIHRLVPGRRLVLGGVEIPYERGLDGHSDADVLIHALCDALLGALGKGDIGEHFPNTDNRYRNISSLILLEQVHAIVREEKYQINNIDVIIIAQEPQLQIYKAQMRSTIAHTLALEEKVVNIKATTPEGLGALGNKEGIAAWVSTIISRKV